MSRPSSVNQYPLYSLIRLVATFVSTDLVTPADPSSIILHTRNGLGTSATYVYLQAGASIIRAGTGAYWREITADTNGEWSAFWRGSGGVQANEEWPFQVRKSQIFNL